MVNKIIAIFAGRFQPFSKHHAATFMWLEKQFGKKNCYIVTSNSVDEKSPLDFNEKSALINMYGFYNIIESKEPYNIDYVVKALNLDINDTAIVILLGEKDKNRLNTGLKKDGTPSYYTKYTNNEDLLPISQKGYVLIMPHVSINVNNEELNGTYVRKYLGDISIPEQERKTAFKEIFGWYSDKFFQYLTQKFSGNSLNEIKLMTPESYRGYKELLPVFDKLIEAGINCTWELSTDLNRIPVLDKWKHTIIIVHDIPNGKYKIDYIRAAGKYKNPRITIYRAELFNNKYYVHDFASSQNEYYYAQIPKLIDDIKKKIEGNSLNETFSKDWWNKQLINEIKIFEYPNLKTLNQFIEELLKINPDIEYEFKKSSYISGTSTDSPDGSFIYLYFENNGTPYIIVTGQLNPNEIYTTSRFHYKLPGKISYLSDINLGTNIAVAAKDFYEDFLIKSSTTYRLNEIKVLDDKSKEYNMIKFKKYYDDKIYMKSSNGNVKMHNGGIFLNYKDFFCDFKDTYITIYHDPMTYESDRTKFTYPLDFDLIDKFISTKTINEVKVLDDKSKEYNIIKFKQYFKDYDVQILDNKTLKVELENFMLLAEFTDNTIELVYINPLKGNDDDDRVNILTHLYYPIDFTKLQSAIDNVDLEENINEIFSKEYWTKNLVLEGGSGGHMAHIFDLPQINTGKDLENAFKVTAKHVESNAASVKIDGVNASVRIVNDEFVLDRGSNKPLDVKGVTTQDLENRFGLGHGFIKTGTEVLKIFNEGLPYTKSELTSLGLLTNPNLMFNVEYVAGQTNVQSYDENFIAIHNILEIYQATPKRRATKEISYDKSVLESYVKKLSKVAAKYGFRVVHEFSTNNTTLINFRPVLSETLEFTSNGKVVKNTLHNWLTTMKLPKGIKVKFNDGKVVDAISKHVLTTVLNNNNLDELAELQYHEDIINGFLTYYTTMKLGDVILQSLNSDLGPLNTQEGIVVKDSPLGQTFKITGQFILNGMNSKFRS